MEREGRGVWKWRWKWKWKCLGCALLNRCRGLVVDYSWTLGGHRCFTAFVARRRFTAFVLRRRSSEGVGLGRKSLLAPFRDLVACGLYMLRRDFVGVAGVGL